MKKKVWISICIIAAAGCLGSAGYAFYYKANESRGQAIYEELKDAKTDTALASAEDGIVEGISGQEHAVSPTASPKPEPSPTPTVPPLEIPVNFEELQQENPDIYAWITVPGTAIDYPVLQSDTDDSFYIHHGADGSELFAGAIYSEMQNSRDFSDPNTVLYGHNMKDGSMFATLHQFRDRDFFDGNREILVYTSDHIYHYEIFAAYTYDDRHILNTFDFKNEAGYQQYLDEIYNIRAMDAFFLDEPKATVKDKLLTLSTCVGNNASARYLVQGILTEVEG